MKQVADKERTVAGIDVGTECIKVMVMREDHQIIGRSILPTSGFFRDRSHEALKAALAEAQVDPSELSLVCTTGFGASCAPIESVSVSETACHAAGAFHHRSEPMTVIDIGGREPKVIGVDGNGRRVEARTARRCAVGIGSFLIFASRHLDVHPTRLEELAATAERPATIGSYCSVFAGTEILERLREDVAPEEIALGCMHSIAERIFEIGGFAEPLVVTGGVAEYFPGVLKALAGMTEMSVEAVPEPIAAGALGAAIKALEKSALLPG